MSLKEIRLFEDSQCCKSAIRVENDKLVGVVLKYDELLCWIQSIFGNMVTEM